VNKSLAFILDAMPSLLQGSLLTLQLTAISVVFGLVGGILLGMARLSKFTPIRLLSRVYIDFFRGTPLLVQLFMIYFGFPALIKGMGGQLSLDRWAAAILALSLNSAAYLAEIVRAGIQSIERGQWEASESLGLSPAKTMLYIVFPQAFRRMIPPLGNEFTTLLKDTSLAAVIGLEELLQRGKLIVAVNYRAFEIYFGVALIYLILNSLSAQVFSWIEKWMDPVEQSKRRAAKANLITEET
jgi:glutamine transport system permease protein